jgi:sugar lactone lactonase YvrE
MTGLRWASIAPGGNWALISVRGRPVAAGHLLDAAFAEASPAGLLSAVDRAAWSRDGSYALLHSSISRQIQRVRLSDGEAFADAPVSLADLGEVTTLAIDASGNQMAFGVSGPGAGLYLLRAGQTPALLSSMAQPALAAFDNTGNALFVFDPDAQRILEFDNGAGPVEFLSLATPDGPAPAPVGLAVSGTGRYLLVADSANRAVRVYDRVSRALANTLPLDFAPSRMDALSSGPTFLLNGDRPNEWLMVLDAADIPRTYFVPASGTRAIKEAR